MIGQLTLEDVLQRYAETGPRALAVVAAIDAIATAAIEIADLTATGQFADASGLTTGRNSDGDLQRDLDVRADAIIRRCLGPLPIAALASEEMREPQFGDRDASICVAIDPLDGSSSIDVNMSIGTIFSLLPATGAPDADPAASFLQAGTNMLGAGFFIYGPQLALVLSLGSGTHVFVFSQRLGAFIQAHESRMLPPRTQEFAINTSNYRHWDEAVRLYVDDCLKGSEGPRDKDFNMRWLACLAAECYRILIRGGVFLYPGDRRRGYHNGRLRLVYEANPIAFLIEQAGGAATDTVNRILEIEPEHLHQRIPLVFGAAREVERIARYHLAPSAIGERAPLFGNRGLFRA